MAKNSLFTICVDREKNLPLKIQVWLLLSNTTSGWREAVFGLCGDGVDVSWAGVRGGPRWLTGVFAGELGLGVTHPLGPLAAALVGAVVAVLVRVAPPALGDARPVHHAVELLAAALDGGREDWSDTRGKEKGHVTCVAPAIRMADVGCATASPHWTSRRFTRFVKYR